MGPVFDDPAAADHDVANGGRAAGKDPGINQCVARAPAQDRMIGIKHEEIGAQSDFNGADRPS